MKRLKFLSTIFFATTFLITVMLISPCFAKRDEIKVEWQSFTMIEKSVETYLQKYDGAINIIRDEEQPPVAKRCYINGIWEDYVQRSYIFRADSDDGKLIFWFLYDYPDPVIPGCDEFQVFGTQNVYNFIYLDDCYLESTQRERRTTGSPTNPNEKAIEYIDSMIRTVDNWRQEWQ